MSPDLFRYARIPGFLSDDHAATLDAAVRSAIPCVVVELGSYLGRSTTILAQAAREAGLPMYAIDLWVRSSAVEPGQPYPYAQFLDGSSMLPLFCEHLGDLLRFVRPVCELSHVAARLFDDRAVGFLFHDASHDRASVAQDIGSWLPKLADGAVWAHHDMDRDGGEVMRQCDVLVQRALIRDGTGTELGVFTVRR